MAVVIHLQEDDDLAVLRDRLRRVQDGRAVLVLPWEASLLSRPLDGELLRREAERLGLEVAVVTEDPDRRGLIRRFGLPVFVSVAQAQATAVWPLAERAPVEPPRTAWWEEEVPLWPPSVRVLPHWARRARRGARTAVFAGTLLLVLVSFYVVAPRATITLVPAGRTLSVIVPVSGSRDAESVDTVGRLVPARRVGDWFEGDIRTETTGRVAFQSGRSTGTVLFTNLLGQDVAVPDVHVAPEGEAPVDDQQHQQRRQLQRRHTSASDDQRPERRGERSEGGEWSLDQRAVGKEVPPTRQAELAPQEGRA